MVQNYKSLLPHQSAYDPGLRLDSSVRPEYTDHFLFALKAYDSIRNELTTDDARDIRKICFEKKGYEVATNTHRINCHKYWKELRCGKLNRAMLWIVETIYGSQNRHIVDHKAEQEHRLGPDESWYPVSVVFPDEVRTEHYVIAAQWAQNVGGTREEHLLAHYGLTFNEENLPESTKRRALSPGPHTLQENVNTRQTPYDAHNTSVSGPPSMLSGRLPSNSNPVAETLPVARSLWRQNESLLDKDIGLASFIKNTRIPAQSQQPHERRSLPDPFSSKASVPSEVAAPLSLSAFSAANDSQHVSSSEEVLSLRSLHKKYSTKIRGLKNVETAQAAGQREMIQTLLGYLDDGLKMVFDFPSRTEEGELQPADMILQQLPTPDAWTIATTTAPSQLEEAKQAVKASRHRVEHDTIRYKATNLVYNHTLTTGSDAWKQMNHSAGIANERMGDFLAKQESFWAKAMEVQRQQTVELPTVQQDGQDVNDICSDSFKWSSESEVDGS